MPNVLKEEVQRRPRRRDEFSRDPGYNSVPYYVYGEKPDYERDRFYRQDEYGRDYDRDETISIAQVERWYIPGPFYGVGPRDYQRSDERIREVLYEGLRRHGQIDARKIQVDVQNGEVTLRGEVNNRRAKRLAEYLADAVFGVTDVNNELRVIQTSRELDQYSQRSRPY